MQGNGFKIASVIFFLALSAWYLIPSARSLYYNQKLEALPEEEQDTYRQENYSTLRNVQEKALKLGLDLQGGMHVTLEVGLGQLLRELADDRRDETFDEVLQAAIARADVEDNSLINVFVQEFEARDANARLSRYFRSDDIGRRASNDEVRTFLQQQADDAILRAIEIIRNRIDRYGVTEPSIQRQGSRRIVVELPGIDDPERVRNLLKGTARLEFRLMADGDELNRSLQRIIEYYELEIAPTDTTQADSTVQTDVPEALPTVAENDTTEADTTFDVSQLLDTEDAVAGNRLLDVFQPLGQGGVVFGQVSEQDTAAVNALLSDPKVQEMLPRDVVLLYTANPVSTAPGGIEYYAILGVINRPELTGEVITDARVDFDETNQALVSMTMNGEGGRTWARVTGANVGKNVAIVLDGVVYSYPEVIQKIVGGRSQITGLDSREEAQDVVNVLKSGALPAPVQIVEERTVGPSLGQASIRAGFTSVMVGLLIVALFMIFYYRTAGVVADLALIINLIFILGILAGFRATLTLPGIAGIVLTIGMAVDANVLIFERIREEQTSGKTLRASIEGGYAKALSAIIDANITTFFVGVILYSFGVGPIQGFAVTLMAGILASLFSAIVFTRIIFDYMVVERRMGVSYG